MPAESATYLCLVMAKQAEDSKVRGFVVGWVAIDVMDLDRPSSLITDAARAIGAV
jgi:hypothetical protein